MKRMSLILALALVTMAAATATFAADPEIIGAPKCMMCHKAKTGDQAAIWEASAHAGAFETLKGEKAVAIAAEKGLGNPWEEATCLGCHTTQHFTGAAVNATGKYELTEGVSCEACHGAGSAYKSKKVMEDHDAAVAAGMLVADETTCVKCHNDKSPTFKGFDYATYWEKIKHPVPAAE